VGCFGLLELRRELVLGPVDLGLGSEPTGLVVVPLPGVGNVVGNLVRSIFGILP
jgi:hypothetical protein